MLVLPADHVIDDHSKFQSAIKTGIESAKAFAAIGVKRLIVPGLDVFLQFQRIVNDSNIRAYDYDQSSFNFGLAARL